ncbi:MAG: efflux RND transporter periplasmic adaptor subunit [Lentisphaerae bacterium]|nr:efflux RND transporter periplasmic adaptor subunit [Lentisphaerota bacterium]
MNPSLRLAVTLAAGSALGLTLSACAKKEGGPPQRPPSSVQTTPALSLRAPVVIATFGNTHEHQSVDVVPQVSGTIVQTLIADGAVVTNGQPLFLIDPRDYAARVQQVEAAVAADRAAVELSRSTVTRNRPLLEKALISTEAFDTLTTRQQAAEAQLAADEAALSMAQLNLERCTVTAPFAGVCSQRYLDTGAVAAAGATRLVNIRSYDPIDVDFSVSEQHLPSVRAALARGDVALTVTPRGDTNAYTGKIVFMDNAINPMTGTIMLRGQVPNPDLKLWSQQFVEVGVLVDTLADAVMVPEGAVQFGKQGPYLFVATTNNVADLRPVQTGVRHQNLIQILSGVAPAERVVVLGQLMLFPGAPVMDRPAGGGEPPVVDSNPGH